MTPSFREDLQNGYWRFLRSVARFLVETLRFKLKLLRLVLTGIDELVIIHHQSIGVFSTLFLMARARSIKYFCVDSSFFCIKSYNLRDGAECIQCTSGTPAPLDCRPFPSRAPKFLQHLFFRCLSKLSGRVLFLCQTEAQSQLVRLRYPKAASSVVGLMTSDVKQEIRETFNWATLRHDLDTTNPIDGSYLIFHGSSHPAKGFFALLDSPEFTSRRIVFPFSKEEVNAQARAIGHTLPSCWEFVPMSWGSGLKGACIAAQAILCPSRWSAPIEGALIKSLCVNGNVIVWGADFSYASEIPQQIVWNLSKLSANEILENIDRQNDASRDKRWSDIRAYLKKFHDENKKILL